MRFRILLEATAIEAAFNTFRELSHNTAEARADLVDGGKQLISNIVGQHNGLFSLINVGDDNSIKLLVALQGLANQVTHDKFIPIIKLISKVQIRKIAHSDCYKNFIALGQLFIQNKIDLSEEFLINPSLYSRGTLDFSYAVDVLKIAHDPNKLKQIYGDNENIKVEDLYKGSEIKPSGALAKNKNDISTIYGTVEMWKRLVNGESETPSKDNKYPTFNSFEKAMKSKSPIVNINGTFKYNKNSNSDFKWEPVN